MRRLKMLLPLPLVLTPALTACNDPEVAPDPVTIQVESSDWSGWERDYEPTRERQTVEAEEGTTFEVPGLGNEITLEVVEIGEDSIELESSEALSPDGETGGINLHEPTEKHTLDRDETTRLSTPSMDAGMHFELSVG